MSYTVERVPKPFAHPLWRGEVTASTVRDRETLAGLERRRPEAYEVRDASGGVRCLVLRFASVPKGVWGFVGAIPMTLFLRWTVVRPGAAPKAFATLEDAVEYGYGSTGAEPYRPWPAEWAAWAM